MPSVTLSAGGRVHTPELPTRNLVKEWNALLDRMLARAVVLGEHNELVEKRRAWCRDHPFHDKIAEREEQTHFAMLDRNKIAGEVMDMTVTMCRLQTEMKQGELDMFTALTGAPIFPHLGNVWAMTAARLKTTNIYWIAREVLLVMDANEEEVLSRWTVTSGG